MGMGDFNSDAHYIYYCGQESLRRNGVALIVNRRQGSQVSMRVARGSASWLSSHNRRIGPQDALKKDDYDGYSISSKGFLPTVVDTMVL